MTVCNSTKWQSVLATNYCVLLWNFLAGWAYSITGQKLHLCVCVWVFVCVLTRMAQITTAARKLVILHRWGSRHLPGRFSTDIPCWTISPHILNRIFPEKFPRTRFPGQFPLDILLPGHSQGHPPRNFPRIIPRTICPQSFPRTVSRTFFPPIFRPVSWA